MIEIPNTENATLPHNLFFDLELNLIFFVDFFSPQGAPTIFCYNPKSEKIASAIILDEGTAYDTLTFIKRQSHKLSTTSQQVKRESFISIHRKRST